MTLIKEDITRQVMNKTGLEWAASKAMVESIIALMKTSLKNGEEVMISGFGQFKTRYKKARVGRNPKTKQEYEISERTVVTFTPSKVFRKVLKA